MKSLFQKWLLLFVALAFIATFGIAWYVHRKQAESAALGLLKINLLDASSRVKATEANLQTILEMSNAAAIAKTRAFAMLIKTNPAILKDLKLQEDIRKKLDVDELHVSDRTGKLIVSLAHGEVKDYIGYKMESNAQSRAFMQAISDPNFELVQEPRYNGAVNKIFQYAGVARLDEPGIVQIGYSAARVNEAEKLADVKKIQSEYRIGRNGKLFITENKPEQKFKETEYTPESLRCSLICGKYLLTAEIPNEEVYNTGNMMLYILFFGLLLIFAVIFILVSRLLQKLVINEISSVTDSLDEISKGNLDKTIEVAKSSELQKLAKSINSTMLVLKKTLESDSKREKAELGIAKLLQQSMRPEALPEHANYRITTEVFEAEEVSGNFHDFFSIDDDHIAILIADVSTKNIAAMLYMMMVRNLFRHTLKKNLPEVAFNLVNAELCRSGQAMPVMVFLGVLNLHTGVMLTFNAGQTYPVIRSANGSVRYFKGTRHPALGEAFENFYTALPISICAGDQILLYSDGVIEAKNRADERFGEERLLDTISKSTGDVQSLLHSVRRSVSDFTGEPVFSNDIAIILLEYISEKEE